MPISNQDSSSLSSYANADLLIIREPNARKIKKNSLVKAIILN
jgi:molybdopterin biosynthesis enzyme